MRRDGGMWPWHDRAGVTALEYALIAGLIGVALIGAFYSLGQASLGTWSLVLTKAGPVLAP